MKNPKKCTIIFFIKQCILPALVSIKRFASNSKLLKNNWRRICSFMFHQLFKIYFRSPFFLPAPKSFFYSVSQYTGLHSCVEFVRFGANQRENIKPVSGGNDRRNSTRRKTISGIFY